MTRSALPLFAASLLLPVLLGAQSASNDVFGYKNFSTQAKTDQTFLAVPDPKLAGEELKILTAEPHIAASPEDHKTALYVASKFKAAGLDTKIIEYRAWINMPLSVKVQAWDAKGKLLMT
ncbi:MAG: glutamate carboxypeptidase, partial [Acidobacteriaceae bacterium]